MQLLRGDLTGTNNIDYQKMFWMSFSTRFLQLRKEHRLTQPQMADKMGIHLTQVRRYESGETQPSLGIHRAKLIDHCSFRIRLAHSGTYIAGHHTVIQFLRLFCFRAGVVQQLLYLTVTFLCFLLILIA